MTYRALPTSSGPLVVGFNDQIMGLDPDTGTIIWEHKIGGLKGLKGLRAAVTVRTAA